jgi:hypothetical protein
MQIGEMAKGLKDEEGREDKVQYLDSFFLFIPAFQCS